MSNQPDQQRGLRYNRLGHVGRIREYLLDKRGVVELSEQEEDAWKRMQKAMSLRIEGYTSNQAALALKKEFGVSSTRAHQDVANAVSLYGDITKVEKQGHRHVTSEMALKAFRAAIRLDDPKSMTAAAALYMKTWGVDKEDAQEFDYSKLQQHVFAEVLDEASKAALHLLIKNSGPIDISKLYDSIATEVESQDVTETDTDE